jgi:hypothetical protein
MIRYALLCSDDHAFEAWFRDSEAFDRQSEAGHVSCPACGKSEVRKALMAPAIRRTDTKRAAPETAPAEGPPPAAAPDVQTPPAPIADEAFARVREALREIHTKLKRDATDVGPAFPEQARAIHEGEAPPRAIYGTATDDEVRSLVEDGVGILPIPALPDDRN